MNRKLFLYADQKLGAYGYEEKPWYLPGMRLEAFLEEAKAQKLWQHLDFLSAPAATDHDLRQFHTQEYIDSVVRRCSRNKGSLDDIGASVVECAKLLVKAIIETADDDGVASSPQVRGIVEDALTSSMTYETYLTYLSKEELLGYEEENQTLRLGPMAQTFLTSARPRLNGPTFARVGVERAARWICGAALDATRRILSGEFKRAFIPIAGFHHAHAEEARLYCLYNDPVLAICEALKVVSGAVAYIDIDIHQGDGVYEAFAENPRVVIADIHEDPSTLFPYSPEQPSPKSFPGRAEDNGRNAGVGTKLNIALKPYTNDEEYLACWEKAEEFLRSFKPEFVVFESGVDGLESDPLSNQKLSTQAIYDVTRRVCALADDCAQGRLLVLGGGGYQLESTKQGWCAVVKALLD